MAGVSSDEIIRPRPHKTLEQFGPGNLHFFDNEDDNSDSESSNLTVRSLVKPFVIKQWIYRGKLYRERKERVPSRFELFFDLVFVAIAHVLSEAAAEQASGAGVAQFILTFYPTWSLWSEFRAFVNASGTDDILQRVGILYMMALLVGYTANASAIRLFIPSEGETTSAEAVHKLFVRAEEGAALTTETEASTRDPALVTAVVFFLLAKGLRTGFLMLYAKALPCFRAALIFQSLNQLVGMAIYFPLLFVTSKPVIIALATLGLAADVGLRYTIAIYRLIAKEGAAREALNPDFEVEGTGPSNPNADNRSCVCIQRPDAFCAYEKETDFRNAGYLPALNIEHFLERTGAFVVIVLGEMVLSVVYRATGDRAGFQSIYGTAICGLIIAFNLCWLYFDSECSRKFLHAIRRHWFSGLNFTNAHFPLCSALIIASAATSRMTQSPNDFPEALRWYFGGGLGCALLSMAFIGMTHRNLDASGTTRLGREVQISMRIGGAIILACLPLSRLNALELLGVAAGVTSFLVISETYGKLHRGEPLSKMSAGEEDAAAAAARQDGADGMIDDAIDGKREKEVSEPGEKNKA